MDLHLKAQRTDFDEKSMVMSTTVTPGLRRTVEKGGALLFGLPSSQSFIYPKPGPGTFHSRLHGPWLFG